MDISKKTANIRRIEINSFFIQGILNLSKDTTLPNHSITYQA